MDFLLYFIVFIVIAAALAALPVMLAARMVDAGRSGFGAALGAVIVQVVVSGLVQALLTNPVLSLAAAVIVGSAIYAWMLDTTFLKGLAIGILATVITAIIVIILASVFGFAMGSLAS